ncbi:MAG TPA: phosphopantothenoylcysteine decarboxylase [Candidatus Omnitrophota bacterium]|nr:phosphopantothenoylcysteine decarboxylase [Candidatus Omnitrophota bacterium]
MSFLKNKRILITAGPTWVPIDDVRVISNISSGEMGLLLTRQALRSGARVDLLLGPVLKKTPVSKKINLFRFTYFDELFCLVRSLIKKNKYDCVLHCAAVSDYITEKKEGKISSQKKGLTLRLKRAPKIIEVIRKGCPRAFLVMFKLEDGVTDAVLLKRSLEAMRKSKADLVVANMFENGGYRGYVLGASKVPAKPLTKKEVAKQLFEILKEKI